MLPHPRPPSPSARTPTTAAVALIRVPSIWSELSPSARQQLAQHLARLIRRRLTPPSSEEKRGENDCR